MLLSTAISSAPSGYIVRLPQPVGCSKAAFSVIMMLVLTAGLCWVSTYLLPLNPLFGIGFLLIGSLGVVLLVDIIQAQISP